MALCIDYSIISVFAGQLTSKRRYAMTYITCIKFHIAFKLTARQIVAPN